MGSRIDGDHIRFRDIALKMEKQMEAKVQNETNGNRGSADLKTALARDILAATANNTAVNKPLMLSPETLTAKP